MTSKEKTPLMAPGDFDPVSSTARLIAGTVLEILSMAEACNNLEDGVKHVRKYCKKYVEPITPDFESDNLDELIAESERDG